MSTRLPLTRAIDLRSRARWTRSFRLGLAALLVGLLLAATLLAGRREVDLDRLALPGRRTVLVLDVSTSIKPKLFRQIDTALERAMRRGGNLGLVLFSDSAYELLAPGTPARELEGVARFYRPLSSTPGDAHTVALGDSRFLRAPWSQSLSSGTQISSGLEAGRLALERDARGRGAVVLLSDLADELGDLPALAAQIELLAKRHIQLRVVALSPTPSDLLLFRSLLDGNWGSVVEAPDPQAVRGQLRHGLAMGLLGVGVTLLLLLALNEAVCARLTLDSAKT